jgi:cytoskeletal protein CcmA (bactofilin family)
MASLINPNNINTNYPVPGEDQDSQGFRTNFTSIANNFSQAASEITDLQSKAILKQALNGTVLNNDMNGAAIQSATMTDMRLPYFSIATASLVGNVLTLDPANGAYQSVTLAAQQYSLNPVMSLVADTVTTVFLEISAVPGASLQFPGNVSGLTFLGLSAVDNVGISNSNPGLGQTLYINNTPSIAAGNARVLAMTLRSTSENYPTQGVVTVTDITDLQSKALAGAANTNPFVNPTNGKIIGQVGDRAGDIYITNAGMDSTGANVGTKLWLCTQDFDVNANQNVSIWTYITASDIYLGPSYPQNSVQFANLITGQFNGSAAFVVNLSNTVTGNANAGYTFTSIGNVQIGDLYDNIPLDANVFGNVNITNFDGGNGGTLTGVNAVLSSRVVAQSVVGTSSVLGVVNQPGTGNAVYASTLTAQSAVITGLSTTNSLTVNTSIQTQTITTSMSVNTPSVIVTAPEASAGYNLVPTNTPNDNSTNWALTSNGAMGIQFSNVAPRANTTGGQGAIQFNNNTLFASSNRLVYDQSNAILSVNGNVTANYFVGTFAGNVTGNLIVTGPNNGVVFNNFGDALAANNFSWTPSTNTLAVTGVVGVAGNVNTTNVYATSNIYAVGNITSQSFFIGNGAFLTGVTSYANSNVAAYLPTYTGNLASLQGNVVTTANVNASSLIATNSITTTTGDITAAGNINAVGATVSAITVTTQANLGNVTNLVILGGNSGQYLQAIGNGSVTWANGSGGGGGGNGTAFGASGVVQVSDGAGGFTGSGGFTFDTGANALSIQSSLTVGNSATNGTINATRVLQQGGANLPAGSLNTIQLSNGNGYFTSSGNLSFDGNNLSLGGNLTVTGNLQVANVVLGNAAVRGTVTAPTANINTVNVGNVDAAIALDIVGSITVGNSPGQTNSDAQVVLYNPSTGRSTEYLGYTTGTDGSSGFFSLGITNTNSPYSSNLLTTPSTTYLLNSGSSGNPSNLVIATNGTGTQNDIVFAAGGFAINKTVAVVGSNGALWFPALANLSIPGGGSGNVLTTNGSGVLAWANANVGVAAYLPTYPGNLISLTGNVTTTGNVNSVGATHTGAATIGTFLGVGGASTGNAVTGEIRATNNITAYYSDERLKTRLGAIENALDKVDQLNGFYHEASDLAVSLGYQRVREVGVSAQEVQVVLPEVVAPAPIDEQYLTVRYERLTPLLIEAVKELRREINDLKQQLKGQ